MAATENWSKTKLSCLSLLGNKVLLNSSTDRKGLSRGLVQVRRHMIRLLRSTHKCPKPRAAFGVCLSLYGHFIP